MELSLRRPVVLKISLLLVDVDATKYVAYPTFPVRLHDANLIARE
jgi:hypothetical protein